mgnify:CR=1 FL=1
MEPESKSEPLLFLSRPLHRIHLPLPQCPALVDPEKRTERLWPQERKKAGDHSYGQLEHLPLGVRANQPLQGHHLVVSPSFPQSAVVVGRTEIVRCPSSV